jgi:hypothetical protein
MIQNCGKVGASDLIRMLVQGKDIEYSIENIRIIILIAF